MRDRAQDASDGTPVLTGAHDLERDLPALGRLRQAVHTRKPEQVSTGSAAPARIHSSQSGRALASD